MESLFKWMQMPQPISSLGIHKESISRATALAGMPSINSFVLNAAVEKAKFIIEQEEHIKLSQPDALMLIEALDSPSKRIKRLAKTASRYDGKTQ